MRRAVRHILRAPTQRQYWRLYLNIFRLFRQPIRAAIYYTLAVGRFPSQWTVRTPGSDVTAQLYSVDDLVTLVECFAKIDYPVKGTERVIVDFGSNIGLSALYFLSHAPRSHIFLYEPVPDNVKRLRENLRDFGSRITLSEVAVGTTDDTVQFRIEPTGRYGRFAGDDSHDGGAFITVRMVRASSVLERIRAEVGKIDILKLDVEGLEGDILRSLQVDGLAGVPTIYADIFRDPIQLPGYRRTQQGLVARFQAIGSET